MDTTRATLLSRLKDRQDSIAWSDFNRLYSGLLFRYARARGLSATDAEDVMQQCMESVVKHISKFEYDPAKGGFKRWLKTMVNNKVIDLQRKRLPAQARTQDLAKPDSSQPPPDQLWRREWDRQHLYYCLEQLRTQIPEEHYEAFRLHALEERTSPEVAALMNIDDKKVRLIKSRTLERLRGMMSELFVDAE